LKTSSRVVLLIALLLPMALAGCTLPAGAGSDASPTNTPFQPLAPTETQSAPEQPPQPTIWLSPDLPEALRQSVSLPSDLLQSDGAEAADLRLEIGEDNVVSRWVYALVAPFPTITDGVSLDALQDAWAGGTVEAFAGQPLLMDAETYGAFEAWWGAPANGATEILAAEALLDEAWARGTAWAIVPFEALEPRWKVLEVDEESPVRNDFDLAAYPLALPISLNGDSSLAGEISLAASNRDAGKLTVVVMTGVTALVRATAATMESEGLLYPARDIGAWLIEGDITHISNEVPFAPDCPPPDPGQSGLQFCSQPEYMDLLEYIGTDVVELTGDHFRDWGTEAMLYTLDLYRQAGLPYYGGGVNIDEARAPLLIEHNGNRFAFIGCNAKAPGYASASEDQPGAVYCGDLEWMKAEIERLSAEGYLVIVTFQHEEYYTYVPQPFLLADFRAVAEAGATIVSGSQAHQPHGLEFYGDALIHYGLGNLFFDQYLGSPDPVNTRKAFIDRHVFYDGLYISTELLAIEFEDFARARPMTPQERADLLTTTFAASIW